MNPNSSQPNNQQERKFTHNVKECISLSREEAMKLGHDFISPEHLMLGILIHNDNSATQELAKLNINIKELYSSVKNALTIDYPETDKHITGSIPLTKQCEKIIKIVYLEAKIFRSIDVKTVHLLLSLLRDEDSIGSKVCKKHGLTYEVLRDSLDEKKSTKEATRTLLNDTPEVERLQDAQIAALLKGAFIQISDHFEPAIGIKDIANEMSRLISNLKASERGKMIGIFGSWGRGKTFLMNLIWEDLAKESDVYERVYFHAWKYQDTQATWAYLYESLSESYFKNKSDSPFKNLIDRAAKIIRLNICRKGYFDIAIFSVALISTAIIGRLLWIYKPFLFNDKASEFKGLQIAGFVIPISIALIVFVQNQVKNSYNSALNILEKYYKNLSYSSLLGTQFEIQKEIKFLLKAWFNKNQAAQKIILIVDDIDRCSEDKVIQVIDSLRIMLEDEEISKRVIVIAAIDERILKLAVARKYFDFLDKNLSMKENPLQPNAMSKQMVTEYLDKLFIAGIKLSKLSPNEKQELFSTFTKGQVLEVPRGPITSVILNGKPLAIPLPPQEPTREIEEVKPIQVHQSPPPEEQTYMLDQTEYDYIHAELGKSNSEITPRQIRIFYFRYLIARNLLRKKYLSFQSSTELDSVKQLLAIVLLTKCFEDSKQLDSEYERIIKLETKTSRCMLDIPGVRFNLEKELILEIFTIADMVIGY